MTAMDVTVLVLFFLLLASLFFSKNRNDKLNESRLEGSRLKGEIGKYESRFSKILDADKELEELASKKASIDEEIANLHQSHKDKLAVYDEELASKKASIDEEVSDLRQNYKDKLAVYERLKSQVAIYEEDLDLAELGLYKPHYDFSDSARYRIERDRVRDQQKALVRKKAAVYCHTEWTVSESRTEGKKMTNRAIRLIQRAFNGECDSVIASVRWNNATRMEARIQKSFDDINKLNEALHIYIGQEYLDLKLKELWLTHEYHEMRQAEKEEQAEIRRQLREEAVLQKEIEEAAKAEESYGAMIQKARVAAEKATGDKLSELEGKIASLTEALEKAHERNERAMSMAQKTKAGYVYVLSNIGSFGDSVYKIGMTRRLTPLDRVQELGDASVPFRFDIHAMIFSEDAPTLEKSLHRIFEGRRLNLVNRRREFFDVTLDEIHSELCKIDPESEITLAAEAREYKESKAIRESKMDRGSVEEIEHENEFPSDI